MLTAATDSTDRFPSGGYKEEQATTLVSQSNFISKSSMALRSFLLFGLASA